MSNRFRSVRPSNRLARYTNGRGQSANPLGPSPMPMARTFAHKGTPPGSRTPACRAIRHASDPAENRAERAPAANWPAYSAASAPIRAPQRKMAADTAGNLRLILCYIVGQASTPAAGLQTCLLSALHASVTSHPQISKKLQYRPNLSPNGPKIAHNPMTRQYL